MRDIDLLIVFVHFYLTPTNSFRQMW